MALEGEQNCAIVSETIGAVDKVARRATDTATGGRLRAADTATGEQLIQPQTHRHTDTQAHTYTGTHILHRLPAAA